MPLPRLHTVETPPVLPEWKLHAACNADVGDVFYSNHQSDIADAMDYCHSCSVQDVCLAYALDAEDGLSAYYRFGVWGGTTPGQRAALARRSRRERKTEPSAPPRGPASAQS